MKSRSHLALIEKILPIAVVLTVLLLAFVTLYPFLPAFLWGVMLAIACEPRYVWLVQKLGGRKVLAAWLMGVSLALAFILPAIGLSRAMLTFLPGALAWIERYSVNVPEVAALSLDQIPLIGPHIDKAWQALVGDTSNVVSHFGDELKGFLIWILTEIELFGIFVLEFAAGIVLAVLLVLRADRLKELAGKFLDRLGGKFAQRMAAHGVETTRSAVRGVLGAAMIQTLVATFSYVVAGVPGWMIWAGITFILALVQIGPLLIWLPMSIWLWASGQPSMALFVFLWGIIVVNIVDNFVRPYLVSKDSVFPASLAFLGAIGGLLEWGVVGVFLGPVITAVAYELILKWLEPDTLPEETIT